MSITLPPSKWLAAADHRPTPSLASWTLALRLGSGAYVEADSGPVAATDDDDLIVAPIVGDQPVTVREFVSSVYARGVEIFESSRTAAGDPPAQGDLQLTLLDRAGVTLHQVSARLTRAAVDTTAGVDPHPRDAVELSYTHRALTDALVRVSASEQRSASAMVALFRGLLAEQREGFTHIINEGRVQRDDLAMAAAKAAEASTREELRQQLEKGDDRFMRFVESKAGEQALGLVGMIVAPLLEGAAKVIEAKAELAIARAKAEKNSVEKGIKDPRDPDSATNDSESPDR